MPSLSLVTGLQSSGKVAILVLTRRSVFLVPLTLLGRNKMAFGEARTLGFNNVPLAKLIVANTIINKNGLFFYNGTPARGSLFLAITNIAGTDAFGNIYAQGFNIGKWSAVTGVQQQHYGLDVNGFTYVVNSAGKTVINEQS